MIKKIGLKSSIIKGKNDDCKPNLSMDYEYAGFFIIDSNNHLHCLSNQLCILLGISQSYKHLSGNFLTKLIYPSDAQNIDYQFLWYLNRLGRDYNVELRFQSLLGFNKVMIVGIKVIEDNSLLVDLCNKKSIAN